MKILEKLLGYILGLMIIAMSVLVLAQVFCRGVFNLSFSWTTELSTFLFSWVIFLGAALGFKDKIHFSMDFTVTKLSPGLKKVLGWVNRLLLTGFMGVLIKYGFDIVNLSLYQTSPAMGISMSFFYATIPVSAILMLVYIWIPARKEEAKNDLIIE